MQSSDLKGMLIVPKGNPGDVITVKLYDKPSIFSASLIRSVTWAINTNGSFRTGEGDQVGFPGVTFATGGLSVSDVVGEYLMLAPDQLWLKIEDEAGFLYVSFLPNFWRTVDGVSISVDNDEDLYKAAKKQSSTGGIADAIAHPFDALTGGLTEVTKKLVVLAVTLLGGFLLYKFLKNKKYI